MPLETEIADETQEIEIPEDYRAFTAFRDGTPATETAVKVPAAGKEKTPPSEPAEEAGQIAEESDTEEEAEQEEDDPQEDEDKEDDEPEDKEPVAKPEKSDKNTRLSKRMRELTGEIKALKSQLLAPKPAAVVEEAEAEVVSAPEKAAAVEIARPMLKDFEDTEDKSAWDQYEAARDAYDEQRLSAALAKQQSELEIQHATETAQANWNKASQRFSDFNEVVGAGAQISQAMESVMRMDPETGTALAYYLGQHPEESEQIAKATLAVNEKQWNTALARAGMELGALRSKLTAPGKPELVKTTPVVKAVTAPSPQLKKVTSASKPPAPIRGGTEQPKPDVLSDSTASDYKKWVKAREAQLKR